MRVLHINTEKGWRGGEEQMRFLMRGLRDEGVEQGAICRRGGVPAELLADDGFSVFVFDGETSTVRKRG